MSDHDGGPAFPGIEYYYPIGTTCFDQYSRKKRDVPGLSLRDYFASAALHGLTMSGDGPFFGTKEKPVDPWPWHAAEAYRAADAMLKAREGRA